MRAVQTAATAAADASDAFTLIYVFQKKKTKRGSIEIFERVLLYVRKERGEREKYLFNSKGRKSGGVSLPPALLPDCIHNRWHFRRGYCDGTLKPAYLVLHLLDSSLPKVDQKPPCQ